MLKRILAVLISLSLAAPASAQQAKTPRKIRYFFGYDYFLPGNSGNGLKDQLKANSDTLIATGNYGSTSSSVNTQGGAGTRVGIFYPIDQHSRLGLSLGYIIGPTMNSNFTAFSNLPVPPFPGNGGTTINRSVVFLRYLLQSEINIPIHPRWTLSLGSGAGLATGRIDQSCSSSGSVTCPLSSARRTWTGFAWEFTPGVYYNLKTASVFMGIRYAGFPRFDGNDQIAPLNWQTYGVCLGAMF